VAIKIGSLLIRLAVEHGILQEGLARSEKDVAKTAKAIERRGREIADFGKNMSLALTLPLAGLAAASIKAAKESADALGQVNAALASMGNQAGRTTEQLQALASSQMAQSLYDDDQILREVTANLLTFGQVSGQQFDRAQQAALDLATRMNGDLKGATIQIGKALNDPIKGVTALSKAGIQFTADQKAMIASMVEAGNVAGAQQIILGELEKQFGGAAQAARDADPGAAMAQSFANFQEEVGAKLLPLLPAITAAVTGVLDAFSAMPEGVQQAVIVIGGLAAALGPVAVGIGAVISAGSGLAAMLGGFPAILATVGAAFSTLLLSPLGLVVGAVGAVVAAWYYWDEIKGIVGSVGSAVSGWWSNTVAPALSNVGQALKDSLKWWVNLHVGAVTAMMKLGAGVREWLVDKLGAIFDWVGRKIQQVTGFFFDMYDAVVGNSYVPDMVDGIAVEFARLQAAMVDPAKKATASVTEDTRKMAQDVMGLLDRLFPEMARARKLAEELALIDAAGLSESARSRARLRLLGEANGQRATVSFDTNPEGPLVQAEEVKDAVGKIKGAMEGLGDETEIQTVRIAQTFQQMVESVLSKSRQLVEGLKKGDFASILEGLFGVFSALGNSGVLGDGVRNFLNGVPGNANGTAYHPGGLMKVGERGPEFLMAPRGSRVIPNHELRAAGSMASRVHVTVGIDETGNLRAAVEPMVRQYSGMAAQAGAAMAQSQMAQRSRRRVR